jgi:chitinase
VAPHDALTGAPAAPHQPPRRPRRSRLRRASYLLGATAVALLALVLTSCGGGEEATPASTPIIEATPATGTPSPSPTPTPTEEPRTLTSSGGWVTAWYAGWRQSDLPPSAIDFTAVTHLVHFAIFPAEDGSLIVDDRPGFETPEAIANVVGTVHAAGRTVLFTIGGAGTYDGFSGAIQPASRPSFVGNLVGFLTTHGYDGIDIDMEPIQSSDYANYTAFIRDLRNALDAVEADTGRNLLLTVAAQAPGAICPVKDAFDQINIMTYDMSGPWDGWHSWYNAPIASGDETFPPPNDSRVVPSAEQFLQAYLDAGCERSRLAISLDFYGYVWQGGTGTDTGGVTRARQVWADPPQVTPNVPYHDLASSYDLEAARWDDDAGAAWLGIDRPGNANDVFVTFDNEQTVTEKVRFVRENGLGGIAIWELTGDYLGDGAPVPNPLLHALEQALLN